MTLHYRAALTNRVTSYNSDTGSFWNFSCTDSETGSINTAHEEVQPLEYASKYHRRQAVTAQPVPQVQALGVSHVIGFNKSGQSTPLIFVGDGVVAYLVGCFVTLFDLRTNCQVQHLSLDSRKRTFTCLAISEDANLLAAGEEGQDPSVVVWLLNQFPLLRPFELKGHKDTITAIAFSPNGNYLATVGNTQDSQLILWDCQMETALCSQLIHIQANLTSLSFSSDSKTLFTAGKSQFTMWNITQKPGRVGGPSVSGISLTSKEAMPSSERGVEVVDVKASHAGKSSFIFAVTRNGVLYKLRQHKGGLNIEKKIDLRVSNASSLTVGVNKLAISCANGIVKIIRTKNLSVEATITKPNIDSDSLSSANVSSDALYCAFDQLGSSLATVYADNSVSFFDASDLSAVRCDRMMQSPSGCITDIFSLSSPSNDRQSIDRNIVKSMRSPHIHNPQAVETEFATCSDKGTISLWNLKMQTSHLRHHVLISPATQRPSPPVNPHVEVTVKTINVNPPVVPKVRPAGRRTKTVSGAAKSTKEPKRTAKTKATVKAASKPKSVPAKKAAGPSSSSVSSSKKAVPKKRTPGLKSTVKARTALDAAKSSSIACPMKGKRIVGTPGPIRMSSDLSSSLVLSAPVVAVPKAGPSKSATIDTEQPQTVPLADTRLRCIRTSPDGLHLVVGDDKGQLRIYHLPTMKLVTKKTLHSSPITTIEFSLPGKHGEILLATGAEDGSVSVMEAHNDFKIKLEKEDHSEAVTGLSFSPEGQAVVSCGRDNYLYYESLESPERDVYDEEDMELFLSRHFLMTSTFEAMHFNVDRQTYMLACSDNFIRVFNLAGQFVHAIQVPEDLGAPKQILQGTIPSMIITCHSNNKVGVFEYFTGKLLAVGDGHSKLTGALLINHGKNLVTTGDDGVMVIWELHKDLSDRCRDLQSKMDVPTEAGYTNELFQQIQREKERASKAESVYSCAADEKDSRHNLIERMASFEHSLFSERNTPIHSRPDSRMSGIGLPMVSPVAQSSQPITMPTKKTPHLPSWMSKADQMSDYGLMDGFESTSPSIYSRPPRLDLGSISDTDDESIPLPMQINRSHTQFDARFSDLDSIPVDHFIAAPGFSRRGLHFENNRFNHPVDSMRMGGLSRDSFQESPVYGFNPCSSLAHYRDERSESAYRRPSYDSSERGFCRPTGPEPPSSVSCASDSRTSTPFSAQPVSCFDYEANLAQMREGDGNDTQFCLLRSPCQGNGPIGPNIHRIASRTPCSMYSDDKTIYSRPNSEEHTRKMFSEGRPISVESMNPVVSPFATGQRTIHWNEHYVDEEPVARLSDIEDDEELVRFDCLPEDQPDTPIAQAGGRMNRNPLYSSGSEASDLAHYNTRPMAASIGSLTEIASLEKETSFIDIADSGGIGFDKRSKVGSPLRTSMDLFWKVVKSSVSESLQKLRDDIGLHQSLVDCRMPTSRKQAIVDQTRHKLTAFLEDLEGRN